MGRGEQTAARSGTRSVWVPIAVVGGAAILLLALLVIGGRLLSAGGSASSPVMLKDGSAYRMYEFRNDDVLLSYVVKLQNHTGRDLEDVSLRAVLPQDAKSGFLREEDASVRLQSGEDTFSLPDGETRSFELVLTARRKKYGKAELPSGALPQLYAVYPDGSEGKIEMQ